MFAYMRGRLVAIYFHRIFYCFECLSVRCSVNAFLSFCLIPLCFVTLSYNYILIQHQGYNTEKTLGLGLKYTYLLTYLNVRSLVGHVIEQTPA